MSRGTTQEKLQWIFGLYDVNNDGLITKTEMVDVVTAIYEMMGRSTEPQVEETSAKEHVEKIFHVRKGAGAGEGGGGRGGRGTKGMNWKNRGMDRLNLYSSRENSFVSLYLPNSE